MNTDISLPSRRASAGLMTTIATVAALLLTACTTPVPVEAPAAPAVSQQTAKAALTSLNFDQQADGFHLSLPAPLIFPFDSTELSPDARDTLLNVGRELKDLGIDRTLVYGYTDIVGSPQYNVTLSRRRADIVARVIAEGGYPANRIDVKGLGASLPIADNSTAQGRSKNRRVVIIVQLP